MVRAVHKQDAVLADEPKQRDQHDQRRARAVQEEQEHDPRDDRRQQQLFLDAERCPPDGDALIDDRFQPVAGRQLPVPAWNSTNMVARLVWELDVIVLTPPRPATASSIGRVTDSSTRSALAPG